MIVSRLMGRGVFRKMICIQCSWSASPLLCSDVILLQRRDVLLRPDLRSELLDRRAAASSSIF